MRQYASRRRPALDACRRRRRSAFRDHFVGLTKYSRFQQTAWDSDPGVRDRLDRTSNAAFCVGEASSSRKSGSRSVGFNVFLYVIGVCDITHHVVNFASHQHDDQVILYRRTGPTS